MTHVKGLERAGIDWKTSQGMPLETKQPLKTRKKERKILTQSFQRKYGFAKIFILDF